MNTLLIHIGTPKTGTSAIQNFLYTNQKELEEYGWCYPDLKREIPEIHVWRSALDVNGDVFFREIKSKKGEYLFEVKKQLDVSTENWDRVWQHVLRHLETKNVILSNEVLWHVAEKFLLEAKKKYKNIKVIVYLRRQDEAIESRWNQNVKAQLYCSKTFEEYSNPEEGVEERERIELLHYLKKLDKISEIVGKQNLIVKIYDKQRFKRKEAITEDFISTLGIKPDKSVWKTCETQNSSLSGNYIELKRVFNSIHLPETVSPGLGELESIFIKLSQYFCKDKGGYFTPKEREAFLEQFHLENQQIAQKYLSREDGVLFDESSEVPLCNFHRCTSFEEDLIRVFSAMIYHQNEEIQGLKNYIRVLSLQFLMQNIKDRKLLLFGAGQRCKDLLEQIALPVSLIVDNDKEKNGRELKGIKIVTISHIKNWTDYFIIVTCMETNEIEEQLQKIGLRKEQDYILSKEYFL